MKIEKQTISVDDGCIDSIGGVTRTFSEFEMTDTDIFVVKAACDEEIIQITLSGRELRKLKTLLEAL